MGFYRLAPFKQKAVFWLVISLISPRNVMLMRVLIREGAFMLELVAGRYRLEAEVGKGGMGTVFVGTDMVSHETIAIKRLKPEIVAPDLIERFKREGEALRALNHPNIVKMLDAIEEAGRHYLILEYFSGGDMNRMLKQGRLSIERVLQLSLDISDALTRAHRLNIIHRDLKPANILLDSSGKPHLSDFGIAYIANKERVTGVNQIVGTLDYVAPEILRSNAVEPRADIWAFGVILYEMLTGVHPFRGDNLAHTVSRILSLDLPDIQEINPSVPSPLADLVYRMLERDPEARVPSVRIVGAELEGILAGHQAGRFETPISDVFTRLRHNLPKPTTAFVGREAEVAEVCRLLEHIDNRLVTILAQGGMGKTRLALEVAQCQIGNYQHGVYFVELAPLHDSQQIVSAIAEALGFGFRTDGGDPKAQLIDYLSKKQVLLVLDNYEHVMDAANLTSEILAAASSVKILVSSRQRLNQSGETVFHLRGMDFPLSENDYDADDYAAVKLFLQAARRVLPDMELMPEEYAIIAKICKLVEGLPLGIVLAASWVSMLSLEEIASEIEKSIDFLENELRDLPERHHSIRAVLDYSWNLLTEAEQEAFMKLALFRGGFTREAAEAVAGANLRSLMSLLNKSLLRRDATTGRYGMHSLLRQYAETALRRKGLLETIAKAHRDYYLKLLSDLWIDFSLVSPEAVEKIVADDDNIHRALYLATEAGLADLVEVPIAVLGHYYDLRGHQQEGVRVLESLEAVLPKDAEELKKHFELALIYLLMAYDVSQARPKAMTLLNDLTDKDTPIYKAHLFGTMATIERMEGKRDGQIAYFQKCLEAAPENSFYHALAKANLAIALSELGRFDEALQHGKDAQVYFSRYKMHVRLGDINRMAGHLALAQGEEEAAIGHFTKAVEEGKAWKSLYSFSMSIYSLMIIYVSRGEDDKVQELLREGLLWHRVIGKTWQTLGNLLGISREFSDYIGGMEKAVEILALVANHPEAGQYTSSEAKGALERYEAKMDEVAYQIAYEHGKSQDFDTVVRDLLESMD
jgi:predicted ATPase/tRNA A-37 threonylcarbamoyl transferase component Bud32